MSRLILPPFAAIFAWVTAAVAAPEPPVLRAPLEVEPQTLDWTRARTPTDRYLVSFLMRGLLRYESDGKLVCDLCREYSVSADGKSYRFVLAPEHRWSDGVALEARHFVDALDRLKKTEKDLPLARAIAEAKAEPGGVLRVGLVRPLALFPHWLTLGHAFPIRKEFAGKKDMATLATLGPYFVAEWVPRTRLVLEANPEYRGPRPVYRVDFTIGTHAALLERFRSGRLDLLSSPTTEDLLALPGREVQVSPYWATRALVFRVQRKAVSSVALRRAVLHALDRAQLPAELKNGERPAGGLIPPGLEGARPVPLVTQDLARAKTEIERAGRPASPLVILLRDQDSDRALLAWLERATAPIGVKWKPRHVTAEAFPRAVAAGDWDAMVRTYAFEVASPIDFLQRFRTGAKSNDAGWTHVGFDAILTQLLEGSSGGEPRSSLYDEATRILESQEVAIVPLGHPSQPFVLGPRVKAFAITPYGDPDLVKIRL